MTGSSLGQRNYFNTLFSWARNLLTFAQANSAFYTNVMENEYQLLLGVKSCSALVGLASNYGGLPVAP